MSSAQNQCSFCIVLQSLIGVYWWVSHPYKQSWKLDCRQFEADPDWLLALHIPTPKSNANNQSKPETQGFPWFSLERDRFMGWQCCGWYTQLCWHSLVEPIAHISPIPDWELFKGLIYFKQHRSSYENPCKTHLQEIQVFWFTAGVLLERHRLRWWQQVAVTQFEPIGRYRF